VQRLAKNKTNGYYVCTICSENASKRHREANWLKYLSQKANARKRPNSEKMTESMLKEVYKVQDKCCAISGLPFDMKKSLYRPSLDRIDSSLGYTKNNIQLVLFMVNKMKLDLDQFEFMNMCYNISDNYQCKIRPYLFNGKLNE
jgi:hypothetical protein